RRGDVRGAVAGVAETASALSGVGLVRAAVWRVPLRGGVRARARRATGLSVRHRLGDDGTDAVAAADRGRAGADRHVPPRAHLGTGESGVGRALPAKFLTYVRRTLPAALRRGCQHATGQSRERQ